MRVTTAEKASIEVDKLKLAHAHPEYVTKESCEQTMCNVGDKVDKFDLALFGSDGRGGMASDIRDIKAYTGIVRQVVIPVVIAVASAVLTAWILTGFRI